MAIVYVPALKAKMGELMALNALSDKEKQIVLPLLEVPDIPWDYEEDQPSKKIEAHITTVAKQIEKNWKDLPFFLDFCPKIEAYTSENRKSALEILTSLPEIKKLKFIPVVGFDRSEGYISNAVNIGKEKRSGVCLRAQYEDFEDVYDEEVYLSFLKKYNLLPEEVDLIIDLSSVCKERSKTIYLALRLIMSMIPNIKKWRNLIVIASSFPVNLSGVNKDSTALFPRVEWLAWKTMYEKKQRLERLPIYGDYSISHPEFIEVDPRIINMSAAIRYSSDGEWVIIKGKSIRMVGFQQFKQLSNNLITSVYYAGKDFSSGDADIYEYANDPKSGTGNATTWRMIGNNHHFTMILKQIQQLTK